MTYWDAYDGTAIRIIDGSESAEINALAVSPAGDVLVSGGGDKLVKLWGYDEGICYHAGVGHSSAITNVKISPDSSKVRLFGIGSGKHCLACVIVMKADSDMMSKQARQHAAAASPFGPPDPPSPIFPLSP